MKRALISTICLIAACGTEPMTGDADTDVGVAARDATPQINTSGSDMSSTGWDAEIDLTGFEPLNATGTQGACLTAAGLDAVTYQPEPIAADVCQCIADTDSRPFNVGFDQSAAPLPSPDERPGDPELNHWRAEVSKTTCGCCHNTMFEGSGTLYWDVTYEPVFTDTFTDARLLKWAGLSSTGEPVDTSDPGQFLPIPELDRLRDWVREELARREAARP